MSRNPPTDGLSQLCCSLACSRSRASLVTMTGTRAPRALGLLVLASLLPCRAAPWSFPAEFRHGVASGDPTPTAIILWTRVTPREPSADAPLNVTWRVSTSASMSDTVQEGVVATGADADYTAKVDAQFAAWNPSRYFFRFELGDARSPVGQFTLPPPAGQRLDALSFGVFSCADWKSGYFNAYAAAAARSPPLDFWLQLGDYLYEYAQGEHPDPGQAVRLSGLEPAWELVQLDDYRRRHALHRTDPDLQALSAAAPLVAVWDDHEIANDPWTGGAQNHQPDAEGGWEARKRAAVRAYHEWMPTRTAGDAPYETQVRSFRALQFGDLANLHVLESRLNARTRQARTRGWVDAQVHEAIGQLPVDEWEASAGPALRALRAQLEAERSAASASLLGPEQLRWLQNGISSSANASGAAQGAPRWQLVGQQTVVMDYGRPDLDAAIDGARRGGQGALADAWERALANITHASADASAPPPTYALYSADDTPRGPARPVDGAVLRAGRVLLAEGRFRIDALFDSWSGYRAERARLLRALGPAANAVIYSGDSHCAWAGTHAAEGSDSDASVAAEYATTSTTSYGMVSGPAPSPCTARESPRG